MGTYNVGSGSTEASIDQVNIWMRSTPWYQNQMRAWGQDPGHPTLSEDQSTQIKRMAQANGVTVDEGNVELDDHGNFNPIGHKLRNTLIVGGVAAATIATMGAAGAFSAAALGPTTAGTMASTASVVGGSAIPASLAIGGGTAAAAAGAGTYASMLARYGLPAAGNLVNGVLQRNADNSARDEQRHYLDQALAYAKEQDAYNRATDASRYADSRSDRADALAKDETRYSGYQDRIRGFIDNGQNSNDRMASLLGLPARPPGGAGSGGGSSQGGRPDDTGDWQAWFQSLTGGKPPTPAQLVALEPQINAAGGKVLRNAAGVAGKIQLPGDPIVDVIQSAGSGGVAWQWLTGNSGRTASARTTTGSGPAAPTSAAVTPPASPTTTGTTVQMRGPDGTQQTVPAAQVPYWLGKGAIQMGANT
jgi:hypothetical protein